MTDPRRGGKGSQSSLNSPNLQGRAAQRSVKSPARPYFSHEFPLAPSSDSISAARRASGLGVSAVFPAPGRVRRSQRPDFSGGVGGGLGRPQ